MSESENFQQHYLALSPERRALLDAWLHKERGPGWQPPLVARQGGSGTAPLSLSQEGIWFVQQLDPGTTLYIIATALRLSGALRPEILQRSFTALLRRHETLRTTFAVSAEQAQQVIHPPSLCALPLIDLTGLCAGEQREQAVQQLARAEGERPFDLSKGPLIRATLLRLDTQEHALLLTLHHLIVDGWSLGLLLRELAACYNAFLLNQPATLPALPVHYADFACWQRSYLQGEALARLVQYWREQLQGCPPLLPLPGDRPRPAMQTFRGASLEQRFSRELSDRLLALSQREGVTLFMLLLAAFATLLSRYSGQDDIVVGSPSANRTRTELEHVAGFFANMLVLRIPCAGQTRFLDLLRTVRHVTLQAYAHQELPFEQLVRELQPRRDFSYAPWTQVHFALHNIPAARPQLHGVTLQPLQAQAHVALTDLIVEIMESETGLVGSFTYNTDLFDTATIAQLARHFQSILTSILHDPGQPLAALSLLTAGERQALLAQGSAERLEVNQQVCLHQLFEAQVARTPDALAVVQGHTCLTYNALDRLANQVAHYLRRLGAGPDARVGICLERSPAMVIGLWGILKAGAAYVPLDPTYPPERLRLMLGDAGCRLLLTRAYLPTLRAADAGQVVLLDSDWSRIAAEPASALCSGVTPANLAYVIYTSGSTGRPKGVMIEHRQVVNFCAGMDSYLEEERPGRWLAVTSLSFDISILELCWPLTRGFQVIIQEHRHGMPIITSQAPRATQEMAFSLFYFANDAQSARGTEAYRLLLDGARFADQHQFAAVWIPERHFHPFGGLYPNPAVLGAALATITSRVQIRAGSVVSPLHHPLRIAEEWAVVDNLSGGRVGISFASGWHADDFVLAPERYAQRKQEMLRDIAMVRQLWRGESVLLRNGTDHEVAVRMFPRPVQAELPLWITSAGTPETFALAGEMGVSVLTHLLGQSLSSLAEKIAVYREAWRRQGHGPGNGHITLMLHTFVGASDELVRATVREPFCAYLKSSLSLLQAWVKSLHLEDLAREDVDALLAYAFDRYYASSGLLGTPDSCLAMVERLRSLGVDEVACLIDFGVDTDAVLASLQQLELVQRLSGQQDARATSLAQHLQWHPVSHLQCTPSLASMLVADQETAGLAGGLHRLLLGGEVLPPPLAAQLARVSGAELHNMYGPTETTIWSAGQRVQAGQSSLFPARPLANTQLYILNRQREPQVPGVAGEIALGGEGVARGYLERPDLTAERFLPDPFSWRPGGRMYLTGDLARARPDGSLDFLGRRDQQIKIRGFRVELAEIEEIIQRQAQVERCAVVVHEPRPGDQVLVAYIVSATATPPSIQELQHSVQQTLPHYMLPSRFVFKEALPLTANGKIDRRALRELGVQEDTPATPALAPRTPLEQRLAQMWQALLQLREVGVYENFFDRGGHSLLALRLISEIQKAFNQRIALSQFLHEPTIAHLAELLTQGDCALSVSPLVAIQPQGSKPPFFCVHPGSGNVMCYYDLARQLSPDHPFYGLQDPAVSLDEFTPVPIETMAGRYVQAIRAVQPQGPYSLGGYSFGGCVAFEMARQLQAQQQEVRHLIILEGVAPGMPGRMKQEDDAIWLAILTQEVIRGATTKTIADIYADLQRLTLDQQLEYIVEQMRLAQIHVGAHTAQWMQRQMLIFKSRDAILHTYRPSPYAGQIILFLTSEIDEFAALELQKKDAELIEGWSACTTRDLRVAYVPGFHDTVLKEPNVRALAHTLRAHLVEPSTLPGGRDGAERSG